MASAGNFNIDDPAKQEKIRREPHEYIPTAGRHGAYRPKPYDREANEFPKMAASLAKDSKGRPKYPRPELKDFLTQRGVSIPLEAAQTQHEQAVKAWDDFCTRSICANQSQVDEWLKIHG